MEKRTTITMSQVMLPNQANPLGTVHGGEIMKFMDDVAGCLGTKYAMGDVVTARVDEMQFHMPIPVGALITGKGIIAYVGNSSMEINITVEVEDLTSAEPPQKALSAFFTMVAIDKDGKPRRLPPLIPETPEEIELYKTAKSRKASHVPSSKKGI